MSLHNGDPGHNRDSTITYPTRSWGGIAPADPAEGTDGPADRDDIPDVLMPEERVEPGPDSSALNSRSPEITPTRMSTFGAASDDSVGHDEVELLMAHLLRSPAVADAALDLCVESRPGIGLLPGLRANEAPVGTIWESYQEVRTEFGLVAPLDLVRNRARVNAAREFRGTVIECVRTDIDRIIELAKGLSDADVGDGTTGRGLLRHFLTERFLREELRLVGIGQGEINWDALQQIRDRISRLDHAARGVSRSLVDRWGDYEARLARYRGRTMLGMATGWTQFDRLTLGLRGVVLLTSRPGAGKSSFFGHAMLGAVRHNPNVCGVYVSLEMDSETIEQRIHAHLSELPLPTLLRGSPELRRRDGGPASEPNFTSADQSKLDRARQLIDEFGPRLMILGREDLGAHVSVEAIRARVDGFKRACGAESAVVVLDYLSLLEAPREFNRSELEADKWRITQARRVVQGTQTPAFPEGDALLVICESRKPANSRDGEWGEGLEDYMGSARLTYAAEMTLNFRSLSEAELQNHYGQAHHGNKRQIIAALEEQAVSPVALKVTKARGASKGEIIYEYRFHEYRFIEQPQLSSEEQQRRQAQRVTETGQAAQSRVKELVVTVIRAADRNSGMSQSQVKEAIGAGVKAAKLRSYNLGNCLDELVREHILERFEGPNPNGSGKIHSRWKLSNDAREPVEQPIRQTSRQASRMRTRRSVNGSVES